MSEKSIRDEELIENIKENLAKKELDFWKNYDVVNLGVSIGECRVELNLRTNKRSMAV